MAANKTCETCAKTFSSVFNLNKHNRNFHYSMAKTQRCILCSKEIERKRLNDHFLAGHGIAIKVSDHQFSTMEAFLDWKERTERKTVSSFVKVRADNVLKNGVTKVVFECHRTGLFKSKGQNVRNLKSKGSNKIGGFCPAQMSLVKKKGDIQVRFSETHVGHTMDLNSLYLSKSDKTLIAQKIASKTPLKEILEDAKNSDSIKSDRIKLLTRHDMYNIGHSLKLQSIADEVAIDIRKEGSLVQYHKPQGKLCSKYDFLDENDFCLILFNQSEVHRESEQHFVCIDGTNVVNSRKFELITCFVSDSVPTAFFITNRTDSKTLDLFYETLKACIGHVIKCDVFISGVEDCFYNSWVSVMGPTHKRFYCPWLVDKDWRDNLNKIPNKKTRTEVYEQLKTLMEKPDKMSFSLTLQLFHCYLQTEETQIFGEYFKFYRDSPNEWAPCYRDDEGINYTQLEKVHKTLKYVYTHGRTVKQLPKVIPTFIHFIKKNYLNPKKGKLTKNEVQNTKLAKNEVQNINQAPSETSDSERQRAFWTALANKETKLYEIELVATDSDYPESTLEWDMSNQIYIQLDDQVIDSTIINTDEILVKDEEMLLEDTQTVETIIEPSLSQDIQGCQKKILQQLESIAETVKNTFDYDQLKMAESLINSILPDINSMGNWLKAKIEVFENKLLFLGNHHLQKSCEICEGEKGKSKSLRFIKHGPLL